MPGRAHLVERGADVLWLDLRAYAACMLAFAANRKRMAMDAPDLETVAQHHVVAAPLG